jgi:hypothetical protein
MVGCCRSALSSASCRRSAPVCCSNSFVAAADDADAADDDCGAGERHRLLIPTGRSPPPPPIDAPCTRCLRHGDPIHARKALTAAERCQVWRPRVVVVRAPPPGCVGAQRLPRRSTAAAPRRDERGAAAADSQGRRPCPCAKPKAAGGTRRGLPAMGVRRRVVRGSRLPCLRAHPKCLVGSANTNKQRQLRPTKGHGAARATTESCYYRLLSAVIGCAPPPAGWTRAAAAPAGRRPAACAVAEMPVLTQLPPPSMPQTPARLPPPPPRCAPLQAVATRQLHLISSAALQAAHRSR